MKLPLYTIRSETQDNRSGYRICVNFQDQLLPLPKHWYRSEEVAKMRVAAMEREDFALMQQESKR